MPRYWMRATALGLSFLWLSGCVLLSPQQRKQRAADYFHAGKRLEDKGNVDGAAAAYQKAVAMDPSDMYALLGLANMHVFQGELDAGIAEYDRIIKEDPEFKKIANAQHGLACIYYRRKDYEKAKAGFIAAIELDPKYLDPHNGLGNVYEVGMKDYDQALAEYNKALAICDTNKTTSENISRVMGLIEKKAP
jgi:tetratricopeptide (TPR) repeat protein